MAEDPIAAAMERVTAALRRKPHAGPHEDTPALVRWDGGLRTVAQGEAGATVATDMPSTIGGTDTGPTPGWLLRNALGACAVTRIAMAAAAQGIRLQVLEAHVTGRSDLCGLLGLPGADGQPAPAGPLAMDMHVRIGAEGVDPERLRQLVASTPGCSPVTCAIEQALPVGLHIDIAGPG